MNARKYRELKVSGVGLELICGVIVTIIRFKNYMDIPDDLVNSESVSCQITYPMRFLKRPPIAIFHFWAQDDEFEETKQLITEIYDVTLL